MFCWCLQKAIYSRQKSAEIDDGVELVWLAPPQGLWQLEFYHNLCRIFSKDLAIEFMDDSIQKASGIHQPEMQINRTFYILREIL